MKIYDLTMISISKFNTYKNPNLEEWIKKIDEILSALGECTIHNDKIENLYTDDKFLYISTSYSIRCCDCTNDMKVPLIVLEAENPLRKANEVHLYEKYLEAKDKVNKLQKELTDSLVSLEKAQNMYEYITKGN